MVASRPDHQCIAGRVRIPEQIDHLTVRLGSTTASNNQSNALARAAQSGFGIAVQWYPSCTPDSSRDASPTRTLRDLFSVETNGDFINTDTNALDNRPDEFADLDRRQGGPAVRQFICLLE